MQFAQFLVLGALTRIASAYDLQKPLTGGRGGAKHLKGDTTAQPLLGFGTWQLNLSAENTTKAVSLASKDPFLPSLYFLLFLFGFWGGNWGDNVDVSSSSRLPPNRRSSRVWQRGRCRQGNSRRYQEGWD